MRDGHIGRRDAGGHTRRELAHHPRDDGQGAELHVRRRNGDDNVTLAAIASLGVGSQYAILTLASEFAERSPWIYTVLWGVLMVPGMVGSGIIGRRAGRKIAPGDAARKAGIRVFLYWLAVVVAVFLIPAAAGMWNAEDGDNIPGVAIGIVSLGYILFGIMHRPVLAAVGVGFAAAFYIPNYLVEGDEVMLVSAASMVVVVVLGAWWIRKSGVH